MHEPSRRTFAALSLLGLGGLTLPRPAVAAASKLAGRFSLAPDAERLRISLVVVNEGEAPVELVKAPGGYLTGAVSLELKHDGKRHAPELVVDPGDPLRGGPQGAAPEEPMTRRVMFHQVPIAAGDELPFAAWTATWPEAIAPGAEVKVEVTVEVNTGSGLVPLSHSATLRRPDGKTGV